MNLKTNIGKSNLIVLLVVIMIINLPLINALNISDIRVEDITESSAIVKWKVSEPSDGFLGYGLDKDNLEIMGNSNKLVEHSFKLTNLESASTYYYQVESGDVREEVKEFNTLEIDTSVPEIEVELPEKIKGSLLEIEGTTKVNSDVTVYLNGVLTSKINAYNGQFRFNLDLLSNKNNEIKIRVDDNVGNRIEKEWKVYADTVPPQLFIDSLPELIESSNYELKGKFSKNVTYQIYSNNKSIASGEGEILSASLSLEEGVNIVTIEYVDEVGWESSNIINLTADSLPPEVSMTLSSGHVYYQGRAYSTITGQTKPGAEVYLYVYRPLSYEYKPDFKNARSKTTAKDDGTFEFSNVNFEFEGLSLDILSPKKVPPGLLDYSIMGTGDARERTSWDYHIFVIVEDNVGRTAHTKETISINTCYSPNQDFNVKSILEFQRPLRLNPTLLDQGKEQITAAIELTYNGAGVKKINPVTGDVEDEGFRISSDLKIERACTQKMTEDPGIDLGCSLVSGFRTIPNADKTSWFLTSNLKAGEEFSKNDDNFWNNFKDRRMTIPLQISFTYQERLGDMRTATEEHYGEWGPQKVQTVCIDLGYFIDVPIESKHYVPDWLANEGVKGINATLKVIDAILPKLEIAIKIVGVACISSFLSRMAVRWWRIASASIEGYRSKIASIGSDDEDDESCPLPRAQNQLYHESTMEHWQEIISQDPNYFDATTKGLIQTILADKEKYSLDERCPSTARLWKMEATLDQAYRWSCDRMYCRAVPAGWTQEKDKVDIESVIIRQNSCAFTALGVPLLEINECNKVIESRQQTIVNPLDSVTQSLVDKGSFTCYRYNDRLYVVEEGSLEPMDDGGSKVKLKLIQRMGMSIDEALGGANIPNELFAYKPRNEEVYYVGREQDCKTVCKQQRGYTEVGCFEETPDSVTGDIILTQGNTKMTSSMYSAGYTSDCFIKGTDKFQCVCKFDEKADLSTLGAREANKKIENVAEDWIYRQDRIYRETNRMSGVYYPEWRYYKSRDFSSAFGADYVTDYFREDKTMHQVNPHNQFIGAWQTICLPRIRGQIVTLKNILEGLKMCILEAKYSSFHDSSTCKTIFAQHVCGLMYKLISYVASSCTPYGMGDHQKEDSFGAVGNFFKSGFQGIEQSMQSSIDDIQQDYGNAQLNNFFATGAQGFAQSLCMAAFGFDFPLGMDFIMDSAYAVESRTTVNVVPAERELVSFNPTTGTAVYNYNIGGFIMSGCKINNVNVYLKCIGQNDLRYPNTQDCSKPDGCDCLQIQGQSPVAGEQTYRLQQSQMLTNIQPNDVVDLRIEAPQRVDSFYRYDHVVVELNIDPMSSAEKCFDEGYRDGKFYFPIRDVSPPAQFECQADIFTGQYRCAGILEKFGGPTGSYLTEPVITCFDKNSQNFVSCETPNLFVINDPIIARVNIMSDGEGQCLRTRVSGLGDLTTLPDQAQSLMDGITGTYGYNLNLGTVTPEMFGTTRSNLIKDVNSASGCSDPQFISGLSTKVTEQKLEFSFEKKGANYEVTVPSGLTVEGDYKIENQKLMLNGRNALTGTEIRNAIFSYQGLKVNNLVGSPEPETGKCVYNVVSYADSPSRNKKAITLNVEMLRKPENGCYYANNPIKSPIYGKASHSQTIYIQRETEQVQLTKAIHQEFLNKNYNYVFNIADEILREQRGDSTELKAGYYAIASHIMLSGNDWKSRAPQINNILDNLKGIYPNDEVNKQTITYLCIIAQELNKEVNFCSGVSVSGECEGYPITVSEDPTDFYAYKCVDGGYQACNLRDGTIDSTTYTTVLRVDHPVVELCLNCPGYNIRTEDRGDHYAYKCVNGGYQACNLRTNIPITTVQTKADLGHPVLKCQGVSST